MILKLLRQRGFKGELGAHLIPWFTKATTGNYHPMSEYDSPDPAIVDKQIRVALANDVTVFFITYQGPFKTFQHSCAMEVMRQAEQWRNFKFALVIDPWATDKIMKKDLGKMVPDIAARQAQMQKVFQHVDVQTMLNSPAYIPEKALLDFNTGTDYTKLAISNARPVWALNKGYSWPHSANDGTDPIAMLKKNHADPAMKAPGLCMSFFDGGMPLNQSSNVSIATDPYTKQILDFNQQNWGTLANPTGKARYTPDRAGNYFFDQLDTVTDWSKFPYAILVTWNDYNERTAWEPWCSVNAGIRIK